MFQPQSRPEVAKEQDSSKQTTSQTQVRNYDIFKKFELLEVFTIGKKIIASFLSFDYFQCKILLWWTSIVT
jgi:hypothetical protein